MICQDVKSKSLKYERSMERGTDGRKGGEETGGNRAMK